MPRGTCLELQYPGGPAQNSSVQEGLLRRYCPPGGSAQDGSTQEDLPRRQHLEDRQAACPEVRVRSYRTLWLHSDWNTEVNYQRAFVLGTTHASRVLPHVF